MPVPPNQPIYYKKRHLASLFVRGAFEIFYLFLLLGRRSLHLLCSVGLPAAAFASSYLQRKITK